MQQDKPSTVTVRIYGPEADVAAGGMSNESIGSSQLKVVASMDVSLTQPDNPNAFDITPEAGPHQGEQFVPPDRYAEWDWNVKPRAGEQERRLHITATMVFNSKLPDGTPMRTEIASRNVVVRVEVKTRLQLTLDWLGDNWSKLLTYLLPSGAGTTFLLYWLSKRRKPEQPSQPEKRRREDEDEDEDDDKTSVSHGASRDGE